MVLDKAIIKYCEIRFLGEVLGLWGEDLKLRHSKLSNQESLCKAVYNWGDFWE